MSRIAMLALGAWCALALPVVAQEAPTPVKVSREAKAKLPRLAILEFKSAPDSWSGWRAGGWGPQMGTISNQLRDLFTTELMEQGAGKLRLIDRERLEDLRKELELQQSGEVDVGTVQKLGKLLGVSYVMTGKVTRFAYRSAVAGVELVGTGVKKVSFTGRLDLRLVEVETGEILEAFREEGAVENTSVKFLGAGVDIAYDGELVNKVFEPVVQRLTPRLIAAIAQHHAAPAEP